MADRFPYDIHSNPTFLAMMAFRDMDWARKGVRWMFRLFCHDSVCIGGVLVSRGSHFG